MLARFGAAKIESDASVLKKLASTIVNFDPRFEIMPGTKAREIKVAKADPYEAVPRLTIAEYSGLKECVGRPIEGGVPRFWD